jgi:glutamate:Na+ symporter, ESS family
MESPFSFEPLLIFGFLGLMLLAGVFLRAVVPAFQRLLFPGCLLGGLLGLILVSTGVVTVSSSVLETMAYHAFNVSFISVGLTRSDPRVKRPAGKRARLKGPLWMALLQGVTFPLQAVLGGLLVIGFGLVGLKLFPTFGFLVPLGFNEGPGQALSLGKVWETLGFQHAATIGLSFATIGYLFSFFVGVPLVNRGLRKGWSDRGPAELPRELLTGLFARGEKGGSAGTLMLHGGNTDSLAFQAALVGLVYLITYGGVRFLAGLLPPDAGRILWGFFFFFGLAAALGVRGLMGGIRVDHLVDSGVQRRITGAAVDFLIVTTVTAIQLPILRDYLVPVAVIALVNGIVTTAVVVALGRRSGAYSLERTAAMFGTVTGTVSCGLLLLRIADPEFRTPVAVDIAVMNVFALPVIGGCTVLVNGPLWWEWSTAATVGAFAAIMAVALVLLRFVSKWQEAAT